MRTQCLCHMMQQADIGDIIQAAILHQTSFDQQLFGMLNTGFAE